MAPVGSHLDSRRRAHAALDLRARARTWQEIADTLGFKTPQGARLAVRRLRQRDAPSVAEMRVESAESLRVMRRRLFDHLEVADRDGDTDTATKVAREIRANLDSAALREGLNAPQRTEVDVKLDPGELVGQWFKSLRAGGRPALPSSVLDVEVVEQ
jgi:hypothetical protein